MQSYNYFRSQKMCLKLAWQFLLTLSGLFLILILSSHVFDEFRIKIKTNSEQVNVAKTMQRRLLSSASLRNYDQLEDANSIAMKKHETQVVMETLKDDKVQRRLRKSVAVEASSTSTNLKSSTEAQSLHATYNQYEDDNKRQPYGLYSSIKMQRFQQPLKYPLQQHLRRKLTNINDRRNLLPKAPTTSLQSKNESPSVTILEQIKMLWDIFEVFTWIWNALVEYYKNSQQQQQQLQTIHIKTQVHLKHPSKGAKNSTELSNFTISPSRVEQNDIVHLAQTTVSRAKRQTKDAPLKSYYDFVIVEASHKFWSIFEISTIIIIIYSIFAAFYYAKLNPLVSKHDYIDYVSGDTYFGNSRHANDFDFEDNSGEDNNEDDAEAKIAPIHDQATRYEWLPSIRHSIKFILDAIDKLPADI